VRGFRIELGEIEATLLAHKGVSEAVVLCKEDELGQKRLLAWVVGAQDNGPSITELREHTRERLPDYMVPSAFLTLEKLPLTPNGKVDREALLAAPASSHPELEVTFVAARTPLEQRLTAIWSELLDLDLVGVHDNFFELGGHSLLVTMLVSRMKKAFHIDLPLRAVFESPTIAGLAAYVDAHG